MKIKVICPTCAFDGQNPTIGVYPVDVTEAGTCNLVCSRNHDSVIVIQSEKYALLYESGAWALYDGYPREAVASFAASVERYYEHVIRVLARAAGVHSDVFTNVWKGINLSERQLGAFRVLYATVFKARAPEMSQGEITFRNDVIHKGEFPSGDEAIDYGEACKKHIEQIEQALTPEHRKAEFELIQEGKETRNKVTTRGKTVMDHVPYTLLFTQHNPRKHPEHPKTLREWLQAEREAEEKQEQWKYKHMTEIISAAAAAKAKRELEEKQRGPSHP